MTNNLGRVGCAETGSRASIKPASGLDPTGFDPARFPAPSVNDDLRIGIVNPYGGLWTWNAFETCEEAEKHLRDFWGKQADEMAPQFKLCQVRVEVIPESEPFDLPSAAMTIPPHIKEEEL